MSRVDVRGGTHGSAADRGRRRRPQGGGGRVPGNGTWTTNISKRDGAGIGHAELGILRTLMAGPSDRPSRAASAPMSGSLRCCLSRAGAMRSSRRVWWDESRVSRCRAPHQDGSGPTGARSDAFGACWTRARGAIWPMSQGIRSRPRNPEHCGMAAMQESGRPVALRSAGATEAGQGTRRYLGKRTAWAKNQERRQNGASREIGVP